MLDHHMETAAGKFVKAIKDTDTYKGYCCQLEKIKKSPALFQQVNEFRQKNYEIQNTGQANDLFDKLDAFEKEYEKFRENPIVDDFLKAELAFCRLMQEINIIIAKELDFE